MEGHSHNQPTSAESSSVVKPVPLYYYVDQFERLYQQSPMAKLFRQELTQPPTPKGHIPQEGRSKHSAKAKGFKLPTISTKERPTVTHEVLDSRPKGEEGMELKVQAGTESWNGFGECVLSRTSDESRNTSGMSESNVTIGDGTASDSSLNQVEDQVGKMPQLSPQPRLLSPSGQDEDRLRKRKPTPNLHNLIKRLKSPDKAGASAPSESKMPTRSCSTKATRVTDLEETDGNGVSLSDITPRIKEINDEGQDPCDVDRTNLELTAGSGLSSRTSRRSSYEPDTEGMSLPSLKETPIPGISGNKRKCVPQRRLLQELRLANNQDRGHHSPRASERNMPYRMRRADIRPSNEKPVNSDTSCQELEVTPKSSSEFQVRPSDREVALSEETPVNQGSGRRKTRSKGSKLDVGKLIRSLQAGQEKTGEDTPRSAISYKGTVDSNILKNNKTEHREEPSSPMAAVESVDVENGGDKEEVREAEKKELILEKDINEIKAMENDPADGVAHRDSTVTEQESRRLTRRQAEKLTNKLAVQKEQEDKLKEEEPIRHEPSEVAKKQDTIINRWIIKPVPFCKGVCVEGHRVGDKEDQFWHSTAIMVRINPRLLATKSGALYRLAGKMDRALTMEQGFSESLIRSFQKGFPDNWRDLLFDHYTNEEKKKAEMKSSKSPRTKERLKVTPVPSHAEPTVPDSMRKAKKKNQVELTPQNLRVKDLQRSSSGRLIKPPLAYWTGQRIRHNTSLDFVEILLGTEDCTSSSVNQISLQDSLELRPRDKRAIKRTSNTSKLQVASAVKKHRLQQRKDDSDVDEESSSCPEPESQTDRGESQNGRGIKWSASKTKAKRSQEAVTVRQDGKGRFRPKATTTDSSENVDVTGGKVLASKIGTDNKPSVFPLRGKSRYQQRSRRNGREEPRMEGSVDTCSSDYPGAATDDTASTSSTKPVECPEGNVNHEREVVRPSRHHRGSKQPPTPKKDRARREIERASSRPQRNASVSPLYYQFSPQSEDEGSLPGGQPAVGKTPSSNRNSTGEASSSTLGPSSSDPQQNSESPGTDVMNVEPEGKMSSERGWSRGAVETLNLQKEILAVVEKHKQGRMARMRERTLRLSASSDRERSNAGRLPSTSDVYELSDDEGEPIPKRIPYVPKGASTNTTTGESVSNWSEEGDKSVNMTWVTRTKPYRRIHGTLEDPQYLTDETTTTETTTTTTTGETDNIVNPVSSDRETTLTETSDDEDVSNLPTRRQKKSLSTRLKSKRTRQGHKPVLDQTSDDEQVIQSQKPVSGRSSKRTTYRQAPQEASSEDTDNTPRAPDKAVSLRLQASSGDTDETIKAGEETSRRGRSKKAIVIQRHQPKRNCKKSGSESDTNNPLQEVENTGNHRRPEPVLVPLPRKDIPKQIQSITSKRSIKRNQDDNRKWKGDSDITPKASQGVRASNSKTYEVEEKQIRETPRREVNGKSEFRDAERDMRLTQERVPPQCATKSSATKPSKQQSKQQENQAQTAVALTAKVGTMKRKRQLRELVEQHSRGYEDDIFDSTPFKKQKKLKIPLGEWDTEEESQEGQPGKTPGSARFKTPSVRYQGVLPLSDKKTPYSNLISPGLLPSVDRKHIDQYIHGLQKKKKGRGLTQRPYTAKQPTTVGRGTAKSGSASLTQAMGDKAADMFDVTPVSDSDPDEDRDYYWSDEDH
ncbi:uncharacterized protein LOC119745180 [Patiria miniata]|uniref:SANTA domain-containing protein n=1 Tax=Patiria miniata TaxID=46514 RepID=A0A914BNP6_PATMI|nr:uncharacterized protein LOC119745180 [Patiria miniata]